MIVFFDDILIYSATFKEHLQHLQHVFELLTQDQWLVKLSKCSFAQESISYLGHVISAQGVGTDPTKVEAIHKWPQPADVKELCRFLGLAGYYRKFVRNFAVIARPLHDLLRKGQLFVWTENHQSAFQALKDVLVSAPVLALPDFTQPFQIQTDASDRGVGAVLLQQGHPLAFVSKALGPCTQGLSAYEKEYLTILVAVEQWRPYLQHGEFTIFSDHRSLMHLTEQRLHTPWQLKMYSKLAGLQYRIIYKLGVSNQAADALSRHPFPPLQLNAISYSTPNWLEAVAAGYPDDAASVKLLQELAVDLEGHPPYSLQNGVIRFHNRVWIGDNMTLQQRILHALHSSAVGGHSGFR